MVEPQNTTSTTSPELLKCCTCKQFKETSQYLRHLKNERGYQYECKKCRKDSSRKYRISHPGKRSYSLSSDKRKATIRQCTRTWSKSHPGERKAYAAVKNGLRTGLIVKPGICSECGDSNSRIHAHHDDYSKPIEVRWLCARCHRKYHFCQSVSPA